MYTQKWGAHLYRKCTCRKKNNTAPDFLQYFEQNWTLNFRATRLANIKTVSSYLWYSGNNWQRLKYKIKSLSKSVKFTIKIILVHSKMYGSQQRESFLRFLLICSEGQEQWEKAALKSERRKARNYIPIDSE